MEVVHSLLCHLRCYEGAIELHAEIEEKLEFYFKKCLTMSVGDSLL